MDQHAPATGVRMPIPGVTYPPPADLARYLATGALGREPLAAALARSFRINRDRVALLGDGWSMTYADLDRRSDRAALALARLGLRPLDAVVFQAGNSPELVVALMGCLKAGLIPLCTLHVHREVEIGGLARHARARAHLVETGASSFDFLGFAQRIREVVPSLTHSIVVKGPGGPGAPTLASLYEDIDPEAAARFVAESLDAIDPFQVAFLQISGGSTGLPKIIPRLQNDYLANMRAVIRATGITAEDCVVTPGPMLHNAGFACFWGPALLAGARVAIPADLTEAGLARLFATCRPTWLYMPKPLLPRLAQVFAKDPSARQAMRGIVTSSGGAQVETELGVPVLHFYGMTEGLIVHTRPDDPPAIRHHSIGWPIAEQDEVAILRPGSEEPVDRGEAGEFVYRGPYVFHGYFDAPEQNAVAFTSQGWVRSGDLVREVQIEGRRALVFEGRLKDLISRGGEKISCEEVERFARLHPAILDIAIVPAPDPVYGERSYAFVVPEPGQACPDVAMLGRHLEQTGLAKFKWPERVCAVTAFPTTSAGKLDRQALRRRAAELTS